MLIKTKGIVFRTTKYSETSLICDIYTLERGLATYIVSGVRSKKAKISSSLFQVMSLVEIVVYDNPNKEVNRLKEIRPALIYQSIPFNVVKGTVGLFMTEVCGKTIKESEANQLLFNYLYDSFLLLDRTTHKIANFPLFFILHLTSFLGIKPNNNWKKESYFDLEDGCFITNLTGRQHYISLDLSTHLHHILSIPLQEAHTYPIPKQERKELLEQLIKYYRLHVENFKEVKAYSIIQEVLS